VLASVVVLLAVVAWPQVTLLPALRGVVPPTLSVDLLDRVQSDHPRVVGSGPLVRVLQVQFRAGEALGLDPFDGRVLTRLSPHEASAAAGRHYVIQRFGYSVAASKTISLTFDDGPDPIYTRRLLDLLSSEKVPATFFVTGTSVARHADLIAREAREGHAVANHTLTHPDLSRSGALRARVELVATDRLLRAVTGKEVGYVRLPYEGDDDESTRGSLASLIRVQRLGYVVTSHDYDTHDWEYAAHPRLGPIPLPDLNDPTLGTRRNLTMLLHDAGGAGRQPTLDFVARLIPYARAHGYVFQTMPQVQPVLAQSVHPVQATVWDRATLVLTRAVYAWPDLAMRMLFGFALISVVFVGAGNCTLALVRRRRRRRLGFDGTQELTVTVLLAAYNEARVIRRTVESVLASVHPVLEVVVVDDGSTDETAAVVAQMAATDRRIVLVSQHNGGKAAALNHGLTLVRAPFVVTVDADTVLAPDTVGHLVRHFTLDLETRLGAVAGVVRVGNRSRNLLTRWQAVEYITQIGVERSAQDALGAILIVPGACAAWRLEAVIQAGGYSSSTLAEDCDLSLMMHRGGWRIVQDDEAVAYTEVPEDVDSLLAQRVRWTYGTLQAAYKHRDLMFGRHGGWLGWFVLPNTVLSMVLPVLFLPFIVVMAVVAYRVEGPRMLCLYLFLFTVAHLVVAAVGLALMGEGQSQLLIVPVYRLIFEPLRAYLLYTAVFMALKGVKAKWPKLYRTGSLDEATGLAGAAPSPAEAAGPDPSWSAA
jgi:peptidoglycan-N-acetylglucosamine deacetylase